MDTEEPYTLQVCLSWPEIHLAPGSKRSHLDGCPDVQCMPRRWRQSGCSACRSTCWNATWRPTPTRPPARLTAARPRACCCRAACPCRWGLGGCLREQLSQNACRCGYELRASEAGRAHCAALPCCCRAIYPCTNASRKCSGSCKEYQDRTRDIRASPVFVHPSQRQTSSKDMWSPHRRASHAGCKQQRNMHASH